MTRPLLLDLFCGAGGAARGYHDAGFDVIGVDINPQPNYPYDFVQADAMQWLRAWLAMSLEVRAIHASPPCQHHTALAKGTNANQAAYPELILETRALLSQMGIPWVIENVSGSSLIDPVWLCGEMFGLDVIRHRGFESNIPLVVPEHVPHRGRVAGCRHGQWFDGPYFAVYGNGGGKGTLRQWQQAMGIDWMPTKKEIAEAIPPAYTRYIGAQLMDAVTLQGSETR